MQYLINFTKELSKGKGDLTPFISKPVDELLQVSYYFTDEFQRFRPDTVSFLHIAAFYDSLDLFMYLIYRGGDILQESEKSHNPLEYAIFGSSFEVTSFIIAKFPQILNENKAYLLIAVFAGSYKICELLLKNGVDLNQNYKKDNNNPLILATKKGNVQIVKLFLKYKSSHNFLLGTAINQNEWGAFKLLLENLTPPEINECYEGKNILFYACKNTQTPIDIFQLIFQHLSPLDPPQTIGTNSESAIHWLCETENIEVIKLALKYELDINKLTSEGKSGPMYFIKNNEKEELEILKLLVDHGFNINNRLPNSKSLLEYFAFQYTKRFDIVKWLIQNGACLDVAFIGMMNDTTKPPISLGTKFKQTPIYQKKFKEWNMENLL